MTLTLSISKVLTLGDSGNFEKGFVQGGVWTVNLSRESDVNLKFPVRFKPYW